MDEDDAELVEALLARVGGLLEDASAVALLKGERSQVDRVEMVSRTLRDAASLIGAARSLAAEAES